MRILLSHAYAWPEVRRGAERILHELSAGLHRAGHDVRVVTTSPGIGHRGRILDVAVTYHGRRRPWPRRFGELAPEVGFAPQALASALTFRPHVWHALGTADAAAAAAWSSAGLGRSVYTSMGIAIRASRDKRADRRFHDFVVKRVDHYCALSRAAGAPLAQDYRREAEILPGGVDLRRFTLGTEREADPTLLFTSALDEPRKNVPLLLEATALLRREYPRLRLVLAGPGRGACIADAPPEAQAAVELRQVPSEEVPELYRRAWVSVMPSTLEAQGLVVVESLACGTPVVTLDEGAPSEVVVPGVGVTCAATPEALAQACAEALRLASKPETRDACRSRAADWDWDSAIVPRTLEVYSA